MRPISNTLRLKLIASGLCVLAISSSASAVNVVVDFSNESNFFLGNPFARAAVNQAANDLSALLTSNLGAVNDISSATTGGTTVNYNFALQYNNPSTGGIVNIPTIAIPADEFRVFVGQRNLTGNTLGQGGPGSFSLNASASSAPSTAAINAANAVGNANIGRGAGPSFFTSNTSFGAGTISLTSGPLLGNLWFDVDTDNSGAIDNATTLSNFWHFDANTPVPSNRIDLYSVALHEIIHALGIGTSDSWNNRISGNNWNGPNVIALLGSGLNTVDNDGGHIRLGLQSPRISDGISQETVLSPSIRLGERRTLTQLDIAFLRDINFSVVIPEPTVLGLFVMAVPMVLRRARR